MRSCARRALAVSAIVSAVLIQILSPAAAQSGFVYNGTLVVGGVKVTGNYDFAFSLWDAPSSGTLISVINKNSVSVTTGAYTVTLDFGAKSFNPPPLYLQIQYRQTGTATWYTVPGRTLSTVRFSLVSQSAMALQGRPVNAIAPNNGQVLKWNGSNWAPAADAVIVYSAGAGLALAGATFSIAPLGVTNAMLAGNAVTTAKIANGAVSSPKLSWPFNYWGSEDGTLFSITNDYGNGIYGKGATGVWGESVAGNGVVGFSTSSNGVYGQSGTGYGLQGYSNSGQGVYGQSGSDAGVRGYSDSGIGVWGSSPQSTGVRGVSAASIGVYGETSGTFGVYGLNIGPINASTAAVRGDGANNTGVWGKSTKSYGVYAESEQSTGLSARSVSHIGIFGYSNSADGVVGQTANGEAYAGYFYGKLSATAKQFRIDHPLDPAGKYLIHSCVESSEHLNVYSGNVTTDRNGSAIVTLPDWFEALNKDFRYQLTVVGQFAQAIVGSRIANGRFTIRTDKPDVEVSWQVSGVRKDAYAAAHPLQVEQVKPERDRGRYLHPTEHGQPADLAISPRSFPLPEVGS